MKKYIVDTNVFLRFLLKDHKKHYQTAKKYFTQAKKGKINLILIPQIVLEINYVLKKVYSLPRNRITNILAKLIKSPDLEVQKRELLLKAVEKYKKTNVDLMDLYLYETAQEQNAQILSFDKDFTRIKKTLKF